MSDAAESPWTVNRILTWAADDFRSRGLDTPRLEAELLLGHVLGLDRIQLILQHERALAAEELSAFRGLIQRRRNREPVAYLLGRREFHGLVFRVDRRVLVPRPETEILVETTLRRTQHRSEYGHLLDLCTGSGCVGISFAKERPTWKVTATDISEGALVVAADNALRLGCTMTVALLLSDLYAGLGAQARFSAIASNPPYIPSTDITTLMADVREFEPRGALDGGPDGLALVRRIITQAPKHLHPDGLLALEVGHDQAERTAELMRQTGFVEVETQMDYAGIPRIVSGQLPERAAVLA